MARNSNNRGNDDDRVSGKIRFIMLETEIYDGNLSEITQAIANAVRPATIIQQVLPAPQPPAALPATNPQIGQVDGNGTAQAAEQMNGNEDVENLATPPKSKKSSDRGERKSTFKGKPDNTIEWEGNGTPFAAYMKQKNPEETSKKYMAIAAWFKLHCGREAIDGNIMWNAYRMMGLTPLGDITQPFRSTIESGYFDQPSRGQYAITKIGLDIVDKMGGQKLESNS